MCELINAKEKWVKRLVKINYTRYFFLLALNMISFIVYAVSESGGQGLNEVES